MGQTSPKETSERDDESLMDRVSWSTTLENCFTFSHIEHHRLAVFAVTQSSFSLSQTFQYLKHLLNLTKCDFFVQSVCHGDLETQRGLLANHLTKVLTLKDDGQ